MTPRAIIITIFLSVLVITANSKNILPYPESLAFEILTGKNKKKESLGRRCYAYIILGGYLKRRPIEAQKLALPLLLKAVKNNRYPKVSFNRSKQDFNQKELQQLIDFENLRSCAIRSLGRSGEVGTRYIKLLYSIVKNQNEQLGVRIAATYSLGELGKTIRSKNKSKIITKLLGKICANERKFIFMIPTFIPYPAMVRAQASSGLGKIGKRASSQLYLLYYARRNDPNRSARIAANLAIKKIYNSLRNDR